MLDNIFPLSVITSGGANVLLQGVHPGFHSVPLHPHINLKSNVVSGQDVVGLKPTLSIQYIFVICYLFGRCQGYNEPGSLREG
jgi:hypothetical protein